MLSYIEMDARKNLALAPYMDKVYLYVQISNEGCISNPDFVFPRGEFSS